MRNALWAVVALLLCPLAAQAQTGTLTPPQLIKGQYVYTIPPNFDPPMIGQAGLTQLQEVAAKLKQPFYVVLVAELPDLSREQLQDARSKEYDVRGHSGELKASYAIDRLADDWATRYGFYDVGKSTIFLLSYNPRKYRMLAGATWKAKLGLEKDRLQPFAEPFVRAMKGSPKDPKGGIVATMQGLDNYLFDQTDPVRIAAREKVARERARMEAILAGRQNLAAEYKRLKNLLDEPAKYLPATHRAEAPEVLLLAESLAQSEDTKAMAGITAKLKAAADPLEAMVTKNKSDARAATAWWWVKIIFYFSGFLLGVFLYRHRKKQLKQLRWDFKDKHRLYTEMVTNGANRYVDAYSDRDDIIEMDASEGETKELWDKITLNVDDIWIGVKAVDDHLGKAQDKAAKGNFFSFGPLREAVEMVQERFAIEYDTEQINKAELFGGETKVIQVQLGTFLDHLGSRFKYNRKEWENLKTAARARATQAIERFPHTTMDELIALCEKHGLPESWLQGHPLAGDDEEDAQIWAKADALRLKDPVGYMKHIDGLLEAERKVKERITNLVSGLTGLEQSRVRTFTPLNTKVSPDKDPTVTLAEAHQEDDNLAGLLVSAAPHLDPVNTQLNKVLALYAKAKGQYATLDAALEHAEKDTELALSTGSPDSGTGKVLAAAQGRLNAARDAHSPSALTSAKEALATAKKCLGSGLGLARDAKVALNRKKHLEARQQAGQALNQFKSAEQHAQSVLTQIDRLDQERKSFEQRLTEMDNRRSQFVQKVRRYGGSTGRVSAYQTPQTSGLLDYVALNAALDAQERAWQRAAREAQRAYEEEEARKRAEAERKRRQGP